MAAINGGFGVDPKRPLGQPKVGEKHTPESTPLPAETWVGGQHPEIAHEYTQQLRWEAVTASPPEVQRDWMPVEVPLRICQELLDKSGKDEVTRKLLNEAEIFIVPITNPDGYPTTNLGQATSPKPLFMDHHVQNFGINLNGPDRMHEATFEGQAHGILSTSLFGISGEKRADLSPWRSIGS